MIYKAFLNRQEITGFPVKGKESSVSGKETTLLFRAKAKSLAASGHDGNLAHGKETIEENQRKPK